jgi:hypothetical protein
MAEAGRFFISLGLNGAEKTLSGLSQVNDHFGGLKTLSTEAKLAILAALAGLEQLVSVGGKFGSQMTMLHEHLNVSIQDLQKYGNAAQIAGSSVQSMYTAFGNIQDALESLRLEGKAAPFFPALMGIIQQSGQNISEEDVLKMGNTPGGDVKFLNLLRKMINNSKVNQFDLYHMISQNGMLPTDIYDVLAMNGGKTFDKALKMAPTVSNGNVAQLNSLNMEWQQTLERFEVAMKNFAATPWIMDLVKGLDNFADATKRLSESLPKIEEKTQKTVGGVAEYLFDYKSMIADLKSSLGTQTKFYIAATSEDSKKVGQKAVDALNKGGFRATMTPTPAPYSSTVTK